MPRVTIKELQAQTVKSKIEKGRLKREMLHANAEHEKARRHLFDQVTQLREALRNEQDNVQSLRRLMNESRSRLPVTRDYFTIPPIVSVHKTTIATHLL